MTPIFVAKKINLEANQNRKQKLQPKHRKRAKTANTKHMSHTNSPRPTTKEFKKNFNRVKLQVNIKKTNGQVNINKPSFY